MKHSIIERVGIKDILPLQQSWAKTIISSVRRLSLAIFLLLLMVSNLHAQFARQGKSIEIQGQYMSEPELKSNFGLEDVFLFNDLSSSKLIYRTDKSHKVNFYYYTQSLADKVPFAPTNISHNGEGEYILSNLKDHTALVIEENNLYLCFWLIDYSLYLPTIKSINPVNTEDECTVLKLFLDIDSPAMVYRGTAGQVVQLDREYNLSYDLLSWSEDNKKFNTEKKNIRLINPGTEVILNQVPTTNTHFTFSGDQYATFFGKAITYTTPEVYEAIAIEAYIVAEQWSKSEGHYVPTEKLGGSAPVDINFYGFANKPTAYFFTWFIYNKENPESAIARFNDKDMSYTFSQFGDFKVMLEVANKNSSCIDSVSVDVSIADSRLDVPNFMMPRNPTGEYTTFKVVSKSIIRFECAIFNRWGVKVFQTTNVNDAWNGKHNGKYVSPGVYYYSIQAEGADGKKYKLGGDINIL